jgi:hypothetical protein
MALQTRETIAAISQETVQVALYSLLDRIEFLERLLINDTAEEKTIKQIQDPTENPMGSENWIAEVVEPDLELETLEEENDYVQQNLKEEK